MRSISSSSSSIRSTVVRQYSKSKKLFVPTTTFDRNLKRLQRDGASRAVQKWRTTAATASSNATTVLDYDYFHREIASRLVDRLDDIQREEGFPLALDLGSCSGNYVYRSICSDDAIPTSSSSSSSSEVGGGIGGIRKLVQLNSSALSLHRDDDYDDTNISSSASSSIPGAHRCQTFQLVADEEAFPLPFPDATFDLVLSCNSLHFVNGKVNYIHII